MGRAWRSPAETGGCEGPPLPRLPGLEGGSRGGESVMLAWKGGSSSGGELARKELLPARERNGGGLRNRSPVLELHTITMPGLYPPQAPGTHHIITRIRDRAPRAETVVQRECRRSAGFWREGAASVCRFWRFLGFRAYQGAAKSRKLSKPPNDDGAGGCDKQPRGGEERARTQCSVRSTCKSELTQAHCPCSPAQVGSRVRPAPSRPIVGP